MRCWCAILIMVAAVSCRQKPPPVYPVQKDSTAFTIALPHKDSLMSERIVAFAKTLLGTRYQFGCMEPSTGFDCSGFINYVFNHFNIEVPRSSVDFTNTGVTITTDNARPGDLILFTGTNSSIRTVGHIGLVVSNDTSGIHFIHASSGKENAVIITPLQGRYVERFVKVIRIVD
jgi:cell wall-associated NlpC family hydrolase